MSIKEDVIIIGAGPAGAIAAYELAVKGIKPLVLEKEKFPRYKACGGALQHKILKILPFDISPIIEDDIHKITFLHQFKNEISKVSKEPLMHCIKRERFDTFLIKKAIEAGATFLEEQQINYITNCEGKVYLKSKDTEFECKILIGADGSNSIVAKSSKLMQNVSKSLAIQNEIEVNSDMLDSQKGSIILDWGTLPVDMLGYSLNPIASQLVLVGP